MRIISLISLLWLLGSPVWASPRNEAIERAAQDVGVPPSLLTAICWAESGLKSSAYRFADSGDPKNSAFGLCQVLYQTGRFYGLQDENCTRDFRNTYFLERNYKACKLFGPYTNAFYAAKVLKYQLNRYGGSWISAIAAYNTGSLKICKTGKVRDRYTRKVLYTCQVGGLLNQKYVDRVLRVLNKK